MVHKTGDTWLADAQATADDAGELTAAELRTILEDLRDSVPFAALPTADENRVLHVTIDANGLLTLEPTPIVETNGQLQFTSGADFMAGEFNLVGFRVVNVGSQLILIDQNSGTMFDLLSRPFTQAGGSGNPVIDNKGAQISAVFQSRADRSITIADGATIGVNLVEASTALIHTWTTIQHVDAAGKFYIRIREGSNANAPIIYTSHSPAQVEAGDVFSLDGNNVTHALPKPLIMTAGVQYYVEFIAVDGPATFRGTITTQADVDDPAIIFTVAGQEVPYFATSFQPQSQSRVWTEEDLTPAELAQLKLFAALVGTGDVQLSGGAPMVVSNGGGVTPPPPHTQTDLQYGKNTSAALPTTPLTAPDTAQQHRWTVEFPALEVGDYWVFQLPTGTALAPTGGIINTDLPGLDQQAAWTQSGTEPRLWYRGPAVRTNAATTFQITAAST